ncbi:MAG TPA: DUF6263 family protein [Fimbriiglobus sp.]|nr:DUF6263 family protein [Fimbriiglobus sp.]
MPRVRLGLLAGLVVGLVSAASAQDATKHSFETRFEKDKPFYQKLTTKVDQQLKVQGGSEVPLKHEQTFYFKWTPISQDKDGKWTVKMAIEGVQFKMDIAGQTIEYDSTNPNPTGASGNPGLTDFFKNLVGTELTVTFGKGMAVEKVDGRDELQKKLAAVNPQMEAVLKSVLTDEAIKEMVDPSAGVTPKEPQPVNGTWEKKATLSLGPIGSYDRTFTYTYKGKDAEKKDLDRIEVKPSLTYKPPTGSGEGLPFRIKGGKLETKEVKQGLVLYNPKAGWVESVRINLVLTGDLDVTIGSADSKVSLTQDQRTELETSATSLLPKK